MKSLPKPEHVYGYPPGQLKAILKELKISRRKFDKAFGVNTCILNEKGELIVYPCDVERALYILGHKLGSPHEWD